MPNAIELANQFQASLVGDGSISLDSLAPLERATAQQISFYPIPCIVSRLFIVPPVH
jgi:UDP-3-O-[3-hydroxymyristoyl] glucosamine N-acyltransferase